ncbi:MAG: glutamate 5-kinase, partial [Candidatus Omnitrophota bacterium]|nr:glutamate 5-kinase [Candidatus Omnitrophota bacterium]
MHKRVVVKVGTMVITSKDLALDIARIDDIVSQLSAIRDKGIDIILVTSGAIGAGMARLNMKRRPASLAYLQATAAIGQNYLMSVYTRIFKRKGYDVGQMLLTQEDFSDRTRYLNIKNTIDTLLKYRAIPVINENDTVATDEIKCGDNDRLSSLVADLCQADSLIILTDVDGLLNEDGGLISVVYEIAPKILKLGGKSRCDLGTGGMATKIDAARLVTRAGIDCVIANGKAKNVLYRIIIDGEGVGTLFKRQARRFMAKKRWIAHSSKPKGEIRIDDGAKEALLKNRSLLASGISEVLGNFISGNVVRIADKSGKEFARGLANYSSEEISKIKGLKTVSFK